MIKHLVGVENLGEEILCKECNAIVHCEEQDWEDITYWKWDRQMRNQTIDCPVCFCRIYRWKDRFWN